MKSIILLVCLFGTLAFGLPNSVTSSKNTPTSRIVGGVEADISEAPYLVAIYLYKTILWCGGSILSNKVVLTAAHCVNDELPKYLLVKAGSTYADQRDGVTIKVTDIKCHEKYDEDTYDNDIALLYLEEDILAKSPITRKVRLARQELEPEKPVTIYGWGDLYMNGPTPDVLHKVTILSMDRKACQEILRNGQVTDNMVCAYTYAKDTCQGDSGGPLIDANNQQIGIVSWGIGCAFKHYPGVYTNLPKYLSWIERHQ